MRGSAAVTIGRDTVYAYIQANGRRARLRVATEEADRLDLFPGNQVRVVMPGQEPRRALVTAVVPAPPFAWVEMELAVTPARAV